MLPSAVRQSLDAALEGAGDVTAACGAAAYALLAAGYVLPSVYVERGGRLRCHAVRGYRQLFDGIAPGVGVIGRTYVTGEPALVRVASGDPAYRQALVEVTDEACVPLRVEGRVVGVVNVEDVRPLPPDALEVLDEVADALGARLAELGPPPESAAQRLVRHATALAESRTTAEVASRLLAAAVDVAGLSSAALLAPGPVVVDTRGPLAQALAAVPPGSLASALTWVEGGSSSRTSPEPGGLAISGQQAFRDVGAETLVLVGLPGPVGETTVLVLADERSSAVRPEVVESLELLASLAAAHLRSAQATELLQREASTDSLTGLPHRRGFEVALEVALDAARGPREHARRSQDVPSHEVAVLMVDLDDFKAVNDSQGHLAGDELLRRVAGLLESALRSQDQLFRLGGDEFASVLDVADAQEAAAVAHRLLAAARSDPGAGGVSIGVAVARPGESSEELLTRADEALYVVKKAGKDGLHLAED